MGGPGGPTDAIYGVGRPSVKQSERGRVAVGTSPSYMRSRTGGPHDAMLALFNFIYWLLQLYVYVLIANAVLSWLLAFNVVNGRSPVVAAIGQFLYAVTEPVLAPIRRFLPNFGTIDVSPVVAILIVFFIQSVILPNLYGAFAG